MHRWEDGELYIENDYGTRCAYKMFYDIIEQHPKQSFFYAYIFDLVQLQYCRHVKR